MNFKIHLKNNSSLKHRDSNRKYGRSPKRYIGLRKSNSSLIRISKGEHTDNGDRKKLKILKQNKHIIPDKTDLRVKSINTC